MLLDGYVGCMCVYVGELGSVISAICQNETALSSFLASESSGGLPANTFHSQLYDIGPWLTLKCLFSGFPTASCSFFLLLDCRLKIFLSFRPSVLLNVINNL